MERERQKHRQALAFHLQRCQIIQFDFAVIIYLFPHLTAYIDLLAWLILHHHYVGISLISLASANSAIVSYSVSLSCLCPGEMYVWGKNVIFGNYLQNTLYKVIKIGCLQIRDYYDV